MIDRQRKPARFILTVILIALAPWMISACGFRPLYAPTEQADGRDLLDQVWIATIQGQNGVILRNYLLDGFYHHGYPQTARYELTVNLAEFVRDVDVQKNDTTTRAQYVMVATYQIKDRSTQQVIDTGQARSVAGYNILLSQYTTLVSQNDAKNRTLRDLADKLQTRTALVLSEPETRMAPPATLPALDTTASATSTTPPDPATSTGSDQ